MISRVTGLRVRGPTVESARPPLPASCEPPASARPLVHLPAAEGAAWNACGQ